MVDAELDRQRRARDEATRAVVESDHPLRLIVAGPGAGKSHAFRLALRRTGGRGIALTFIRTLAAELAKDLDADADAYTFHAYSKHLLHALGPTGLTRDFTLFPPLFELMTEDLGLLGVVSRTSGATKSGSERVRSQVERAVQDLEPDTRIPPSVLRLGTYYDAASFIDLVYRVFLHLEAHPDETPEHPLVVVDEYQDFTRLETAFIAQLGLKSPLLIAGDDDQALHGFRHASPEHIRNLAGLPTVERHELPYCSRRTAVVVAAANTTIERALATGHLQHRLDKPFACYLPEKRDDSLRHPTLLDARCSVHRYMATYVEDEITRIPQDDIDASIAGRHPTALVVGPSQFVKPIHRHLNAARFPEAELRASERLEVEAAQGFRLLARDEESNLEGRILVHASPFVGWKDAVRDALERGEPLASTLPAEWRLSRLASAGLLRRALLGEELDPADADRLAAALGLDRLGLAAYVAGGELGAEEGEAVPAPPEAEPSTEAQATPTILCTTLKGAKGLSAECRRRHREPPDARASSLTVDRARARRPPPPRAPPRTGSGRARRRGCRRAGRGRARSARAW